MFTPLGTAILQFAPVLDRDANLERLAAEVEVAVSRGARLVVAPEYSSAFEKEPGEWMREVAEPLDGPFVRGLTEIAERTGVTIVAGFLERASDASASSSEDADEDAKPWNSLVAVGPQGVVAHSRKTHLYDAFGTGESEWLAPGAADAAPAVFEVEGMRFGLQTCYDLRFPEVSRRLIDAGAHALVVPAEWVRGPLKEHHWSTLLRARAIENIAYVIGADQSPPVAVGRSAIVDPRGIDIAAIGSAEGIAIAWLDAGTVTAARTENPALGLRKYGVSVLD